MSYQLDDLDIAIVSHLQENGSLTNAGIAERENVPVSEETVRRRIKRLVREGLIRIVAVPDPTKLGYESEVLIGVQVEADKVGDVADALTDIPEITWVTVSTGAYDVFAWATLKTSSELSSLLLTKVSTGSTSAPTMGKTGRRRAISVPRRCCRAAWGRECPEGRLR